MGGATDVVHRRCGRRPCEEMDDRVVEELRAFISQRLLQLHDVDVTFRHLKQHLRYTRLPYGMFSLPDGRYADTLDDEVDAIAVRCDGGARDVECVSQPGYEMRKPRLRVKFTSRALRARDLAVALFRKRPRRRVERQSASFSHLQRNRAASSGAGERGCARPAPLDRAGISGARRPAPGLPHRVRLEVHAPTVEFQLSAPPAATPTHATRIARSIVPRHKPATPYLRRGARQLALHVWITPGRPRRLDRGLLANC